MLQDFRIKPWAHQLEALERFSSLGRILLRHDMGTGKTLTGCLCLRHVASVLRRCPITIIFCPLSVIPHWEREIEKNCNLNISKKVQVLRGTEKERVAQISPEKSIYIVNYEVTRLKKLFSVLKNLNPDFVILDECHKIKGPKSLTSLGIRALIGNVRYRLLLSGTPVLNSAMDVWAQLQALGTGAVDDNYWAWIRRHFYDANSGKSWLNYPDWKLIPGKEQHINRVIALNSHTALKSECLDLPPLVEQTVEVTLTPEMRRMYDELEEDFLTYLDSGEVLATDLAITKLIRLMEICNGVVTLPNEVVLKPTAKLDALADILESTGKEKVVIWCNFLKPMAAIEKLLENLGIVYVRFTGAESAKDKQAAIDVFNTDPSVKVFLATQAAGGVGIGLQAASVAVTYSQSFNLEHYLQSAARTYRGGSEIHSKITHISLITSGTVEEQIAEALSRKMDLANLLLTIKREHKKAA